jgi:hypothetical protein
VLHLAPTPVGDAYVTAAQLGEPQPRYPLDLYLCPACGLAQLIEVVDPDVLYGNFTYTTSVSLGLTEHFRRSADALAARIEAPVGKRAIDIGSNDGTLLRFLRERGMNVLGIEPAGQIAAAANGAGIETVASFLTPELAATIRRQHGPAALVTANNTLANVDDLRSFLNAVATLLEADGLFVIETGYLLDIVDHLLFDTIYHEHLCYFTAASLLELFKCNGMQLIDVERIPTKGGSLRAVAQLKGGPRPVAPSVAKLLAVEEARGLRRAESFATFAERVGGVKEAVADAVRELKSQGKTIAGYGASVGVTTLLCYLDIGAALDGLVDDNPTKHGRYSPGYHLPVCSSSGLYAQPPDYVLILAWRYAEAILARHAAYRERGGRFIKFLPRLEVL